MRFTAFHLTQYEYSSPVSLGAHVLRLLPQGNQLSVAKRELSIDPLPVSIHQESDAHGNLVERVTFSGETTRLLIQSRFEATTQMPPPLLEGGWARLPWASLERSQPAPIDPDVQDFAVRIARESDHSALSFLLGLTKELYQRTDRQVRHEGEAQTALQTLVSAQGACRDLTVLFLDCCRALGLTGRFVSGYQSAADTPDGQRYLHAWPEVFLPGLGYRGFDPTHGVPVEDGHVALCGGPTQADTMPVEGGYSFQGSSLTSTLNFQVQIQTSSRS